MQPFGCLPNHICGRGMTKRIKEDYPGIQILPLELDPDTSFANVENRLQMMIMNEKSRHIAGGGGTDGGGREIRRVGASRFINPCRGAPCIIAYKGKKTPPGSGGVFSRLSMACKAGLRAAYRQGTAYHIR